MKLELATQLLLACNLYMFGVMAFVHLVHYPSMRLIEPKQWKIFHDFHISRTQWVVTPPMGLQLLATVIVLLGREFGWYSLGLLSFALLSLGTTFFISMPLHQRLSKGFNEESLKSLISFNYFRLLGWGGASLFLWIA